MDSFRALIVDDEPLARTLLREFLKSHPDCTVIGECSNGLEAVRTIDRDKPDILFLDIQMPKLTGFEVLELIDHRCSVIFTTAYDEYALKAFDVHAIDYLLKPFSQERFDQALDRARRQIPVVWEEAASDYRKKAFDDRVIIKDGASVHIIPADRIDYIEAQDDYVEIHAGKEKFLKKQTVAELESRLNPSEFLRIHRSYILRLDRLSKIEMYAKDSRLAVLKDGRQIPISRSGYEKLKALL